MSLNANALLPEVPREALIYKDSVVFGGGDMCPIAHEMNFDVGIVRFGATEWGFAIALTTRGCHLGYEVFILQFVATG